MDIDAIISGIAEFVIVLVLAATTVRASAPRQRERQATHP